MVFIFSFLNGALYLDKNRVIIIKVKKDVVML